jgi:4-diphosphocytidyl-2-C-methyl-D-erythritol kinase
MNRPAARYFSIEAPAKLNLHLEILGRRPDGYHDLRSLFLMVDLADRLRVGLGGNEDLFTVTGAELDPRHNTARQALELFRRETGISEAVSIQLEKRIPTGSGLGGGSSDAASLLRLLNEVFGNPLSADKLSAVGAAVGSDICFFLNAPCAAVEGRGEAVHPCAGPDDGVWAVAVPEISVLTTAAYRWFDEITMGPAAPGPSREDLCTSMRSLPPARWNFFNSFWRVVSPKFPLYGEMERKFAEAGALFHNLSGSGSAYFGVFSTSAAARDCLESLEGGFRFKGLVQPVRVLPSVVELSRIESSLPFFRNR